jgi:hypothetical protein
MGGVEQSWYPIAVRRGRGRDWGGGVVMAAADLRI